MRLELLKSYLIQHKHADLADWFSEENKAGVKLKSIVDRGGRNSIALRLFPIVLVLWIIGLFAVSNILMLFLLGVIPCLLQAKRNLHLDSVAKWLMFPFAIWQWLVLAVWGSAAFSFLMMAEEKATATPGHILYLAMVIGCFVEIISYWLITEFKLKQRVNRDEPDIRRAKLNICSTIFSISILIFVAIISLIGVVEQQTSVAIEKTVKHEGRYFAEVEGASFPK